MLNPDVAVNGRGQGGVNGVVAMLLDFAVFSFLVVLVCAMPQTEIASMHSELIKGRIGTLLFVTVQKILASIQRERNPLDCRPLFHVAAQGVTQLKWTQFRRRTLNLALLHTAAGNRHWSGWAQATCR